ncbi:hypothetical protein F2Q68_00016888 [Brassica cretica]|uniref:Uncharacterized protein n=1 Tax=Brassica cretica TaxID=69181 RepID=A0A8S9HHZ7_BRACR|nr:hypothetical protein F2Q68_00016888 [Brassica cretica]
MGLSEYDQWKEANQQLNQIDQNARQNRQQAENVHEHRRYPKTPRFFLNQAHKLLIRGRSSSNAHGCTQIKEFKSFTSFACTGAGVLTTEVGGFNGGNVNSRVGGGGAIDVCDDACGGGVVVISESGGGGGSCGGGF